MTLALLGLGGLLGLAFEPVTVPYLAPAAIAGLSLALTDATSPRTMWRALPFGIGYLLTVLGWLHASIGTGAWLALGLVQALWFVPLGWALTKARGLRYWPIWSAALWSTVEQLRGSWPLGGFPWGRLGMVVVDTPWAALLPLVGIPGTGFVIALLGFAAAAVIGDGKMRHATPRRASVAVAALVVAVLIGFSFLPALLGNSVDMSRVATVAVVQGGVPGDGTDLVANHRQVTRNHLRATRELARQVRAGSVRDPDFVVWPENSTAVDPFTDTQANSAIEEAATSIGRPLLVGAMVDAEDPSDVLNQGIVWDSTTGPGERYTKRHPVPFGEYIPFRSALGNLSSRLSAIPRDMLPGTVNAPLDIAGARVAIAICFDVAFDDVLPDQVRQGADVIVVQTSNAMFTGTAQPAQQFAISRARALETGRSVIVASTNGISGVIGPDGQVITQGRTRGTEVLVADVPLSSRMSVAMRLGPAIDYGIAALAASAILASLTRRDDRRFRPSRARPHQSARALLVAPQHLDL